MRRIRSACCARAASGHAAAAPPSSVMNSRRSHSITSSALASSVGGTVRPSIRAVLSVDDQLELGRLHDRQVRGLGALENAAGIDADLTLRIRNAGSVAHQPAGLGKVTRPDRSPGPRGAPPDATNWTRRPLKKGSGPTNSASGRSRTKRCEGRIDLAAGAGVEDLDLQPDGASSRFHVSSRWSR